MRVELWRRVGILLGIVLLLVGSAAAQGTINTVAGTTWMVPSGPATNAAFGNAQGVAVDSAGNIYFAETAAQVVYMVTPTGTLSVVAGTGINSYSGDGGPATAASLTNPYDVAIDSHGNIFITEGGDGRVRMISASTGNITTIAGTGVVGFSGDFGPATQAQLGNNLFGISVDSAGNVFVADATNNRIRFINTTTGIITTFAGAGTANFSGDGGPAYAARLASPSRAVPDAFGNVYIADMNNNRVRKVNSSGIISTISGNGGCNSTGDGGPATLATVCGPWGLTVDSAGDVIIADSGNLRIRKIVITSSGTTIGNISTIAGTGTQGFSGDNGPATLAAMSFPETPAFDASGNLYFADNGNSHIRKINTSGTITTIAGSGGPFKYAGDGGPATAASMYSPIGMAFDSNGNLYIAENNGLRIRKVTPTGNISTFAGTGASGFSGDGGPATQATFSSLRGMAFDSAGNLYAADSNNARVRKIDTSGNISTFAGSGNVGFYGDGGAATLASLNLPSGLAFDSAGNLYVAEINNSRVRKITPGGTISTFAGNFVATFAGDGGPATLASLNGSAYLAFDAAGNLYISDGGNHRIRRVNTSGIISTVAGNGNGASAGDGGLATDASIFTPRGVAADADGSIYIAEVNGQRIRKVNPGGIISTIAGNGIAGYSGDGGPATASQVNFPFDIRVNASKLYIADLRNDRIRAVGLSSGTVSAGIGVGAAGSATRVPIFLALSPGVTVDSVSFSVSMTPTGSAPALTGSLTFLQDSALPQPNSVDSTTGAPNLISVAFLGLTTPLSGSNVHLGDVLVSIPASASAGNSYAAQVLGASGSLTSTGAVALTVGNNGSASVPYTAPTITTISPANVAAGAAAFTLTVNGTNFTATSVVLWNGAARTTTFVSATQVTAAIAQADVATATVIQVRVLNSPGGPSNAVHFLVTTTPSAQGTVTAATSQGVPGLTALVPITLNLNSGASVDSMNFGLVVMPNGSAPPLTSNLTFTPDPGMGTNTPIIDTSIDTTSGQGQISVFWGTISSPPAPLSGTVILGQIGVPIPSGVATGQTYTIAITGSSGSLSSVSVPLSPGANAALNPAAISYLVGDTFPCNLPEASPTCNVPTGNNGGQFGDSQLNNLDLIVTLRAVTNLPGWLPSNCSDRFDAMDSSPKDTCTGTQPILPGTSCRGGDHSLNNLDLIITLRRVTNIDSTRPLRVSRGLCIASAPVQFEVMTKPAIPASGDLTLDFGAAEPVEDGFERVPVYLNSRYNAEMSGFSYSIGVADGATTTLKFIPGDAEAPSIVDAGLDGILSIAWLDGFHAPANERLLLGYVIAPQSSTLRLLGGEGTAADTGRGIPLSPARRSSE